MTSDTEQKNLNDGAADPAVTDDRATLARLAQRLRDEVGRRQASAADALSEVAAAQGVEDADLHRRLARLGHELRTPLGAIAAMAEIMRDERFGPLGDARYGDYARSIWETARHLISVAESMLDQGAGAGGRAPMSFVELDVQEVAQETVAAMRPLADACGITLEIAMVQGLARVIADRSSVRQIITNVIDNALKFTPRGGAVGVAVRQAGARLLVEVLDAGHDVDEVAVRDDASRKLMPRAGGGHGIGLPLSRALAAANGARLTMERRQQGGMRVTLAFEADRLVHG